MDRKPSEVECHQRSRPHLCRQRNRQQSIHPSQETVAEWAQRPQSRHQQQNSRHCRERHLETYVEQPARTPAQHQECSDNQCIHRQHLFSTQSHHHKQRTHQHRTHHRRRKPRQESKRPQQPHSYQRQKRLQTPPPLPQGYEKHKNQRIDETDVQSRECQYMTGSRHRIRFHKFLAQIGLVAQSQRGKHRQLIACKPQTTIDAQQLFTQVECLLPQGTFRGMPRLYPFPRGHIGRTAHTVVFQVAGIVEPGRHTLVGRRFEPRSYPQRVAPLQGKRNGIFSYIEQKFRSPVAERKRIAPRLGQQPGPAHDGLGLRFGNLSQQNLAVGNPVSDVVVRKLQLLSHQQKANGKHRRINHQSEKNSARTSQAHHQQHTCHPYCQADVRPLPRRAIVGTRDASHQHYQQPQERMSPPDRRHLQPL